MFVKKTKSMERGFKYWKLSDLYRKKSFEKKTLNCAEIYMYV